MRRRAIAIATLGLLAASAATAALAFWTAGGSGEASASAGSLSAAVISVPASASGSVELTWDAQAALPGGPSDEGEIAYTVERRLGAGAYAAVASGGCAAPLPHGTASCTDTVDQSGSYTYRVVAAFRSWTAVSAAAGPVEVTVAPSDTTPPEVVSIVRAGADPSNQASVSWTVTFSEDVTGVDASDFDLTGTGVVPGSVTSVTGSGSVRTVSAGTGTGDGSLRLDLDDDDSIQDAAGNPLGGAGADDYTGGEAYTIDKSPPYVVSADRAGAATIKASSAEWTVTFSEPVTGVDAGDFALQTSGGISGAAVTGVTGSGATRTVTVSTGTGSGTIRLDVLDDDSILDAAANPLNGAPDPTFAGQTVTVDRTAPSVSSVARAGADPTNASSVTWTVTFSEPVTGVDATDFTLHRTGGLTGGAVTGVTGGGSTYSVTASTGSGDGGLRLDVADDDTIADGVGNTLASGFTTGEAYTIDRSPPNALSINRTTSGARTNAASVSWTVTFNESVTGVDASDFTLAASGLGGSPAITGVTGSGSTRTVTASTGTGDGTLTLNLTDDDSIIDAAGNRLGGTGAGNGNLSGQQYVLDRTRPSVLNPTTTGIRSFESNGTTTGDGIFEAGDYLKITFDEDMTGVAATGVTVRLDRTGNGTIFLAVTGITTASSTGFTGSGGYFSQSGSRSISSADSTITLESSGGLTNNVVVVRVGPTVTGNTPAAGQGALALNFDGGIADGAGNVPNNATAASTFRLF